MVGREKSRAGKLLRSRYDQMAPTTKALEK
jgi:hypothetical protein